MRNELLLLTVELIGAAILAFVAFIGSEVKEKPKKKAKQPSGPTKWHDEF